MRSILGFTITATLAVMLLATAPAQATFPGKNGKLAFEASDGIHAINPDGSGDTLLVEGGVLAKYSPDGTMLAYFTVDGLYVANADGTSPQFVTDQVFTADLAWSPDGSKLLLVTATRPSDLVTVDLRTRAVSPVVPNYPYHFYYDWSVANKIVRTDCCENLYTFDPDGTGSARIYVNTDGFSDVGTRPSWYPDGRKVGFNAQVGPNNASHHTDIFAIDVGGTNLTDLLQNTSVGSSPVWSPDGTRLAFAGAFPNFGLGVANADGTDATTLVSGSGVHPTSWQPIPGPKRSDYKNANQFCKAEQAFWGDQFSQRYRNFGQCVGGSK